LRSGLRAIAWFTELGIVYEIYWRTTDHASGPVSSGSVLAGVGHRRTRLYQAETNELAL